MVQATKITLNDEARWQAVCDRDADYDGQFVFAVLTTGIYCRPSCPARRANPENVSFFDNPAVAEKAGYRACKRCRPDAQADDHNSDLITRAARLIEESEREPSLAELASLAGLSPGHFQRLFKKQTGISPKQYAIAMRRRRFQTGLRSGADVTSAIFDAGYESASRAYADQEATGLTPARRRAGAAGEKISFATGQCSLGEIVIAATARGVCLVEFLDGREAAEIVGEQFPGAVIAGADDGLRDLVAAVVAVLDGDDGAAGAGLPLDIRGTAFQERVWRALINIPAGETVSYATLARSLGQPKAVRAVASACARNRLAVLVPCHRVVRGDGALAGYRWGIERKRALIERESKK